MGSASREGSSTALPDFMGGLEGDPRVVRFFCPAREVELLTQVAYPSLGRIGQRRPLWLRAGGLRLEPVMPAQQIAWLRLADGGFLAVLTIDAESANGCTHLRLPLTVEAHAIRPAAH